MHKRVQLKGNNAEIEKELSTEGGILEEEKLREGIRQIHTSCNLTLTPISFLPQPHTKSFHRELVTFSQLLLLDSWI